MLMPSYGCGAELEPVLKAKAGVKFYRVDKSMRVDLSDLESRINENTAAIHVTHYNGFPQPIHEIKKICLQHDLLLIEDCAHILVGGEKGKVGSFGDIAIFSVRKILPLPDGGILAINSDSLHFDDSSLVNMDLWQTLRSTQYLLKRNLAAHNPHLYNLANRIISVFRSTDYDKGNKEYQPEEYKPLEVADNSINSFGRFDQRMSWLSQRLLLNIDCGRVIQRRRKNFQLLLEEITGLPWLEPVFKKLPDEVCPLFFMVTVDNPLELYRQLLAHNIESHPYWDFFHPYVPWDEFPDAVYLKTHVLALPIHQDIDEPALRHMVESLKKIRH